MGKISDLTGQRFGRLTVLRDAGRKFGGVLWECQCECGKVVRVRASGLVCGDNKSCGKRGECHHHWGGGHANEGSRAWASKRLCSGRIRSEKNGYAPPENNPERVMELWRAANGKCQICDAEPANLYLDHDHTTGALRGFICNECNHAIGLCKDSAERLRACADYLDNYQFDDGTIFKA
jgi:hypothetical protein